MRSPFRALFDRRSIVTSADVLALLTRGASSLTGISVTERSTLNVGAVRTAVGIRSELLATLPVSVIEQVDHRTTRVLREHWLRKVLSQPNTWQTKSELHAMLEVHRLLRGNAFTWLNWSTTREGRVVVERIPIHPDQLEVTEKEDDWGAPTQYWLHKRNGQRVPVPAVEISHLKSLSTNGRLGRSFIQDMREVIGGTLANREHMNTLLGRDATPPIVLSHPKNLSEKAKKGLEDSWEKTYGHGKDKRRVAVIEEGMKIEKLSLTPADAQFLQTDQDLRAQILAELRLPAFLGGLLDKQTSWGTGIEQQMVGILIYALAPSITIWEERFNRDYLQNDDVVRVKFNPRAMLRGDLKSQADALMRFQQMGVYSPNDIRAFLDENPIPGPAGDAYLQPVNMAPLGSDPFAGSSGKTDT